MSPDSIWLVAAAIAAGVLDLAFAAFHVTFWRLFGWPERLAGSGDTNAAITQTLNIMLTFVFITYGIVMLGYGWRLLAAPAAFAWAGAGFWALRTVLQVMLFSMGNWPSRVITGLFVVAALAHAAAGLADG